MLKSNLTRNVLFDINSMKGVGVKIIDEISILKFINFFTLLMKVLEKI